MNRARESYGGRPFRGSAAAASALIILLGQSGCGPVCVPAANSTPDAAEYCRLINQNHREQVTNKVLYWVVLPATAVGVFALAAGSSGGGGGNHRRPPLLSSPLGSR